MHYVNRSKLDTCLFFLTPVGKLRACDVKNNSILRQQSLLYDIVHIVLAQD